MKIEQLTIKLPPFPRGFHLITSLINQELPLLPKVGLLHLFIKHTSAGLILNENASPDVRIDFENVFNQLVPENLSFITHTIEGPDDMPAHIKSALVGASVHIPITNRSLNIGIWQGIYLCEFRNYASSRTLIGTIVGE